MKPITIDYAEFAPLDDSCGRLVSASLPAPGLDALGFLSQARGHERFLWVSQRDDLTLAGFGIAAELVAWGKHRFQQIRDKAAALFDRAIIVGDAQPRLFGGFAFQDDFVPDNTWTVYAPACFILPHYQLTQADGQTWLTINTQIRPDDDPDAQLPSLVEALEGRLELLRQSPPQPLPIAMGRGEGVGIAQINYPMSYATWERIITEATARIHAGDLAKVVLARACELRFDGRVDVDCALAYLAERYAECYRFLFEPRPYHAFYGATPELLVWVDGQNVKTMGLAGSVRRGTTPDEDAAYAAQIFDDPKERHEHALVVDAIDAKLRPLTEWLNIPDAPQVLALSNIQHLHTPIHGRLREASGALPLVELLHPTPALGGDPRDAAMDFICKAEPVPRGWYAAPVGWLDPKLDGAFSVSIRSAVSQDKRVWLYAGAGIVGASVPQKEWDETALKFTAMLNAHGAGEVAHVRS